MPAYEEDGLTLFESGAIVMHIAEKSEALLPVDPDARARVRTWMFAALNTVEPPIMMLHVIDRPSGAGEVRAQVLQAIQTRLDSLAAFLGERHYLVTDRFTAADLLMITVLRALRTTDLIGKTPALQAYCLRGEARPAFQRALAAQLAPSRSMPRSRSAPRRLIPRVFFERDEGIALRQVLKLIRCRAA